MLEKVQKILDRCEELHRLLGDPGVLADQKLVRDLGKELSTLEPIAKVGRVYIKAVRELDGSREVMDTSQDPDMKSLAFEEYSSLKERVWRMEEDPKLLMVPQDPNDTKNFIMEIRAGTGGGEAGPLVAAPFRVYPPFSRAANREGG